MAAHRPAVDILLPTFNGERFVHDALESVFAQTMQSWRMIVVDDGSTDATLELIGDDVAADSRVTVLVGGGRRAPGARMLAARQGDAPVIAFIDQDDRWMPEKLQRQLAFLDGGGFDAIHTAVRHIDEDGRVLRGSAWEENRYRSRHATGLAGLSAEELCRRSSVRLTTAIVRRDVFDRVGGFDERLFGGEDWSFWLDLVASGHRLGYLDEVLTERRLHATNTSTDQRGSRRRGLVEAIDRMAGTHPELERCLEARRVIVGCGTALHELRSGHLRDAARSATIVARHARSDQLPAIVRYGFQSAARGAALRVARLRRRT